MKEDSLSTLMHQIHKKNLKKRRPSNAVMELTYKCNHKCMHCYTVQETGRKELSKKELFFIIDQFFDMGTVKIIFTGGEIFTRPDIMDIIFYARKKGFQVLLITNGTLITEKITARLIRWGVSEFEISFLGASREIFDAMTQYKGSFDKVVRVVKMLKKKGVRPHIKTCVTKTNLKELGKIGDLAAGLNLPFSFSPFIMPRLNMDKAPLRLSIRPEDFLCLKKNFRNRRKRGERALQNTPSDDLKAAEAGLLKKGRLMTDATIEEKGFWERKYFFNCVAGHTTAFINPYGEMKPCAVLPEPNYDTKKYGVRECWVKIKKFADRLKPSRDWECYSCEYRNWCCWCPGIAYLNSGDIFGCSPYLKESARVWKRESERNPKKHYYHDIR